MLEEMRERFRKDLFAAKMGIEIIGASKGYGKTGVRVTAEMLNAAAITHGAVVFAVADLAFAVAANTYDKVALGLNMNISYVKATTEGVYLTAEATEDALTNRTGLYRIVVRDEKGETVAVAEGLVYRLDKTFEKRDGN